MCACSRFNTKDIVHDMPIIIVCKDLRVLIVYNIIIGYEEYIFIYEGLKDTCSNALILLNVNEKSIPM